MTGLRGRSVEGLLLCGSVPAAFSALAGNGAIVDKPSLFIGSSTEGLEFARAARSLLAQDAETTIWNEGFFGLGSTFIETLINSLGRFDFALLVLTPDDLIASRRDETLGPRDNVIFELGLFMGRLGRSRTFILHQSDARVKIPSDLAGVTSALYQWPRADGSYQSAVGAACDRIREVVRDLGVSEAKAARAISAIRSVQEDQARKLKRQQAKTRSLQVSTTTDCLPSADSCRSRSDPQRQASS